MLNVLQKSTRGNRLEKEHVDNFNSVSKANQSSPRVNNNDSSPCSSIFSKAASLTKRYLPAEIGTKSSVQVKRSHFACSSPSGESHDQVHAPGVSRHTSSLLQDAAETRSLSDCNVSPSATHRSDDVPRTSRTEHDSGPLSTSRDHGETSPSTPVSRLNKSISDEEPGASSTIAMTTGMKRRITDEDEDVTWPHKRRKEEDTVAITGVIMAVPSGEDGPSDAQVCERFSGRIIHIKSQI